jgi:hypothetical protein
MGRLVHTGLCSLFLGSTCPPLSPFPHANRFVIGSAVINTHTVLYSAINYTKTVIKQEEGGLGGLGA